MQRRPPLHIDNCLIGHSLTVVARKVRLSRAFPSRDRKGAVMMSARIVAVTSAAAFFAFGQTPSPQPSGAALPAATPQLTGFPFSAQESLRYTVKWPSGVDLGEATMTAQRTESGWSFSASATAVLPGFAFKDHFRSQVTGLDLCSSQFERDTGHGNKNTRERTTFDQRNRTARRVTVYPENGGETKLDLPACARDALAFIYYARREMGQGRVAPQQSVYFGSSYSVRMNYTGEQTIALKGKSEVTDRVMVYVKGPKSDFNFEIYFARDAARTPLTIKIPLSMATFSMELAR